jgi:hypothetical protein
MAVQIGMERVDQAFTHIASNDAAWPTVAEAVVAHQITNRGREPVTHYIIELLGPSATRDGQPMVHKRADATPRAAGRLGDTSVKETHDVRTPTHARPPEAPFGLLVGPTKASGYRLRRTRTSR